jgi:hypothetical protein
MLKPGDKLLEISTNKIFTFCDYIKTISYSSNYNDMIVNDYDYENGLISINEDAENYHRINKYLSIKECRKEKLKKLYKDFNI